MLDLKKLYNIKNKNYIIIADEQTSGVGRRGNTYGDVVRRNIRDWLYEQSVPAWRAVKGLTYAIISRHTHSNTHTCKPSVLLESNVIAYKTLPCVVPPVTKEVKIVWQDPVTRSAAHEKVC